MVIVSISGKIWQEDCSYEQGPICIETYQLGLPDMRDLVRKYEEEHGTCAHLTIRVTK